jgi:hypothetical protein
MAARPETLLDRFLVTQPAGKRARDRWRRRVAAIWMEHGRQQYEETGHPLHAWFAITMAWEAGKPPPESVLLYFVESAGRLLTGSGLPRKNQVAKAVASAVGLECRSRVNPFAQFRRPSHEHRIAMAVRKCQMAHPHYSLLAVFTQVAEEHGHCSDCSSNRKISVGTVKRYWYRLRKSLTF